MTSESCTHQQTVHRFSFPTPCNTSVLPPAGLKHPDRVSSAFPSHSTEKSTKGQSVKVQNSPGGSLTGRFPCTTCGYQQSPLSLSNSWGCMPQDPRSLGPSKREWIEAGSPPMGSVLNNSPQPSHFTPPTPRNPSHHLQHPLSSFFSSSCSNTWAVLPEPVALPGDISAFMGRGDTQGVDPTQVPCPFRTWEPPAWALLAPSEGVSPWALQSDPPADLSSSPFGLHPYCTRGFPGSSVVNNPPCQSRRCRFDLWIRKIPWRRK